jgi:hypothetical protein
MQITNNVNLDIEHAPKWFKDAIKLQPTDEVLENPLGNISYSMVLVRIKNGGILLLHNF